MTDLKLLRTFSAVAQLGSLSKAAAKEGLTQSALSRQIALLERDVAQRLFVRTGRGVALTEAGASLLRNASVMLELADNTRSELAALAESPSGRVTIGISPRVGRCASAPIVQQFCRTFPRAVVHLFEGTSHHLREALILGRIDLAAIFDPSPSPRLHYEPLCKEQMVLVGAASGKPLPRTVRVKELPRWPMILPGGSSTIRQVVDAALARQRVTLNVIAQVDSVQGMLSLAAAGSGYVIVPRSAIDARMLPAVQVSGIERPAITSTLVLAVARAGATTRLITGAAQLIRELDFSLLTSSPAA